MTALTPTTRSARRRCNAPGPAQEAKTPMQTKKTTRRPGRVMSAKNRCRKAISLMPNQAITEDGIGRALVELAKATTELETEMAAMKVRRARDAKRRIPRGGLRDSRGFKRSVATLPGYNSGRAPANKGKKYPPTPPTVNEVLRMLALAPTINLVRDKGECPTCHRRYGKPHSQDCINPIGERLRAWIYLAWRGGLRNGCELLRLTEADLHPGESHIYVAHGKNDKPREVVVDEWVWPAIAPWLRFRQAYPAGPLFCVINGATAGVAQWGDPSVRKTVGRLAREAGITHRVAPHQFRHARAVEDWESGIDPLVISRNLGHSGLNVTDIYFKSLPQSRIDRALRARPMPTVSMMDVLRTEAREASLAPVPDLMGALSAR